MNVYKKSARGYRGNIVKQKYYTGPITDHFNGNSFNNLTTAEKIKYLNSFDGIKWYFHMMTNAWTGLTPQVVQAHPREREKELKVTMIGHASILLQIEGYNILVDPVWSPRIGPVFFIGKKRVNPPGVPFSHLPPIDAVLITHNHYDHMDIRTLRRLYKKYHPVFFTPLGNDIVLKKHISNKMTIHTMDWFEELFLNHQLKITLWPAYHWSARGIYDRNHALWGGFIVSSPQYNAYFTGDTSYGDGTIFKQIKERFPSLDVAVINIGAYAPRAILKSHHNDPEEAVNIFLDCGAKQALGIHWGTFQLSSEEAYEPVHTLYGVLRDHLLSVNQFIPMRPGQTWRPRSSVIVPKPVDPAISNEPPKE
ncbi:L-ascorbate lactonase UlaG [Commensalibacter communis]|uniref:Metallo-beta-lactamase superfamily (UlaG) n=1 Tax=Commensalibacter communis TaxID=2972786 RepID=A0A9W4TP84_9PROT|nr:L-ascorbate lactonase UlaG [Commensalibacter communis]CAI3940486.1 L-ascorbate lactonase UlaG [Commensalibacter communis]CAI3943638.1 L-ascorbate lactonase UlaG [Commensalibacter communis]CAI3946164.1 L-ascorbate lactonase UlaG [Commensalibacter communis]